MSITRFNFIPEINKNTHIAPRLVYISTAKHDGDCHSAPHSHTCAEIFYVTGGQGSFLIDDQTYPVEKDDLLLINSRVQHTEISDESQPLEYIVLGVDGLELTVSDDQKQFHLLNFRQSEAPILVYLKDMLREIEAKAPGYDIICQSLLKVLLARVMRSSNQSARMVPSGNKVSKECAAVRRYIDGHFKESLSLDQLAAMVHINKYHMVHSFTKAYGVSPINYLLSLRLQESRYLLRSTDYAMSQIAQIVGFSSPCYFSQVFHKAMGMSPREYRNTYRQSID